MTTKINKQQGSIHLVVTILLGLIVCVLLGWVFWQNFLQPKTSSDNSTTTPSASKSPSPEPTVEPVKKVSTFTISEWGIQFIPVDSLSDTMVKSKKIVTELYPSGTDTYYGLTTDRILTMDNTCHEPVVLLRYTTRQPSEGGGSSELLSSEPINGYWYYSSGPSTGPSCISSPDTTALRKSLLSIEAIR